MSFAFLIWFGCGFGFWLVDLINNQRTGIWPGLVYYIFGFFLCSILGPVALLLDENH